MISRLALVEAVSAFALKVREGQIQMTDFALYRKRLLADIRNRMLSVIRVRPSLQTGRSTPAKARYGFEVENIGFITARYRIRLAGAMLNHLVCADVNLCKIAAAEGLSVVNPETV